MEGPRVSVIIPNYNHAPFLERRIDSILRQTFQDFEVIILDDASEDQSKDIISQYASLPRIRVHYNTVNTGIPGKQWNKGVKEARGEYVWIAESDDYAEEHFLETLVAQLDNHPTAGIVYCQSYEVNEVGDIIGTYHHQTIDLDRTRWQKDYFNNGKQECSNYLFYKNTIPNASAVLFRKTIYEEAGYADEWIRYCGDWLMWVKMLMISDLVFVSQPLNSHRRHGKALSRAPGLKSLKGPSPLAIEDMDIPDLPFEHELVRWPAKMRYILGRNALRANRPKEARALLRQSLRLHVTPAAILFYGASFLGRPVYSIMDGIKKRVPILGSFVMQLSRLSLAGHRFKSRRIK